MSLGQSAVYPIQATLQISPPYTTRLSDYIGSSAFRTQVFITLNDLNEPSWDTRLKITIQGNGFKLYTRPDYIPPSPFVIYRDAANLLDGADLSIYFNSNVTVAEGINKNQIFTSNTLPEGYYTICVEVADYQSGKVLSNAACSYVAMQLPNVPITIQPRCSDVVPVTTPQQILFTWSPVQNISSYQPNDLSYQVQVFELTSTSVAPEYAVANGMAQLIFTSDWLQQTSYLYSLADPPLTPGHRYVYRIQARFNDNDVQLRNQGYSEICSFYYGYPTGGTISTFLPDPLTPIRLGAAPIFSWSAPSNVLSNQSIRYLLTLTEIEDGQSPVDALLLNAPFYTYTSPETLPGQRFDYSLPVPLSPNTSYAWRVQAYSGSQLTAESQLSTVQGPPLLNGFYAQKHYIKVNQTYTNSTQLLNGEGEITLASGKKQPLQFANLSLDLVAGNWVLRQGEITQSLVDTTSILLTPYLSENQEAYFHPRKIKVNPDGLFIQGFCSWAFPHATISGVLPKVYSTTSWANYSELKVIGTFSLAPDQSYQLLDPFRYVLQLESFSTFSVSLNEYRLFFHGNVKCPTLISAAGMSQRQVLLPFQNATQLFYFTNQGVLPNTAIQPIQNFNFHLTPQNYTFDFSSIQSPHKLASNANWKGVYFDKSIVLLPTNIDAYGQLKLAQNVTRIFEPSLSDSSIAYVDGKGQTLHYKYSFQGYSTYFNTFPSTLTEFSIEINQHILSTSGIKGHLKIPFLSETNLFHFYAPIHQSGLYAGYLTDIEGYKSIFRPDKATEKLLLTVHSAVFNNQDHLAFVVDIDWPFAGIQLTDLSGLKAWGDYHIGFLQKQGSKILETTVDGTLSDYPYRLQTIGAGRGAGFYAIGFSGDVRINDDISGATGTPLLNTYCTMPNSLIPVDADQSSYTVITGSSNSASDWSNLSASQQETIIAERLKLELQNSIQNVQQTIDSSALAILYPTGPTVLLLPDSTGNASPSANPQYNGLRGKLNSREFDIVQDFTTEIISIVSAQATLPLKNVSDSLSSKINNQIDSLQSTINTFIRRTTDSIIYTIVDRVIQGVSTDGSVLRTSISIIADTISIELSNEIIRSLTVSIEDNIKSPTNNFLRAILYDSTKAYVQYALSSVIDSLLEGNYSARTLIQPILQGIPRLLHRNSQLVIDYVHPSRLAEIMKNTALQAISGIDLAAVASNLTGGLTKQGQAVIAQSISALASQQANAIVGQAFANTPGLHAIAPPGIRMDFHNMDQKIKSGRIDQIITVDPTNIAVNTKFVSFSGQLKPIKDSIYGNAWKGYFDVTVKKPKPFSISSSFLSGKKQGHEFWFCQISSGKADTTMGGTLSRQLKPFQKPVHIGPVSIVGGKGRVYKGMREIGQGVDIIPDAQMDYGAYLNLVIYDTRSKGEKLRIQVETEYTIDSDHHYIIELRGNLQSLSNTVSLNTPDPTAVLRGNLLLYYNSEEDHFLGQADVTIEKTGVVCGHGYLLVETKPGVWKVHFGDRESPNRFILTCNTLGLLGWVKVENTTAEIGGGLGYYMRAFAGIDIGVLEAGIGIDAGIEAMAWVVVSHSPRFTFNQLGIRARAWVNIFVYYETIVKSGTFTLLDVEVGVQGIVTINPKPANIQGAAWGHIKILSWDVGFDANFKLDI
jgi:hypothetical protein